MAGNPIAAYGAPTVIVDAATQVFDCTTASSFAWTLAANRTMTPPANPAAGQIITVEVTQDATGSRLVTWPANFSWATNGTAPTLTTTAARTDVILAVWNSTANKWRAMTLGLNMV
jgi:hypothetical protein